MKIAICGTGGFSREVAPLAWEMARAAGARSPDAVCFVPRDGEPYEPSLNGHPIIPLAEVPMDYGIVIAIAEAAVRRRIDTEMRASGRPLVSLIAPTALRRGPCEVGEGAILCDHTILTADVRIGRQFHANLYSYVAHDCVIGDFVTLAPRVCINGNTVVEDDVYIGTGAILRQGTPDKPLRIGKGAVIGMGAVVTKDVAPGETVIGNPARPLERR